MTNQNASRMLGTIIRKLYQGKKFVLEGQGKKTYTLDLELLDRDDLLHKTLREDFDPIGFEIEFTPYRPVRGYFQALDPKPVIKEEFAVLDSHIWSLLEGKKCFAPVVTSVLVSGEVVVGYNAAGIVVSHPSQIRREWPEEIRQAVSTRVEAFREGIAPLSGMVAELEQALVRRGHQILERRLGLPSDFGPVNGHIKFQPRRGDKIIGKPLTLYFTVEDTAQTLDKKMKDSLVEHETKYEHLSVVQLVDRWLIESDFPLTRKIPARIRGLLEEGVADAADILEALVALLIMDGLFRDGADVEMIKAVNGCDLTNLNQTSATLQLRFSESADPVIEKIRSLWDRIEAHTGFTLSNETAPEQAAAA